jgi:hypothetical protein
MYFKNDNGWVIYQKGVTERIGMTTVDLSTPDGNMLFLSNKGSELKASWYEIQ